MHASAAALQGAPGAAWAVAGSVSSAAAPRAAEPAARPIDFRSFPMMIEPPIRPKWARVRYLDDHGYHRWRATKLQFRQIDRVRHGLVAGVTRMEVVAAVIGGEQRLRVGRVAGDPVEVDDRVELAARADPRVHRDAGRLQRLVPRAPALEGQDGGADDADPAGVCLRDHLVVR